MLLVGVFFKMNEKPRIKRYFMEGKDYLTTKVPVNVECIDMRISGQMINVAQKYPMNVYVKSDYAIVGVDKEKDVFLFGYRMSNCKSMLDLMGFTVRGNKIKILVEGVNDDSKSLVSKLASIVMAPTKY